MVNFLSLRDKLKNSDFIPAFALIDGDRWLMNRAKDYIFDAYSIANDDFSVVTLDNPSVNDLMMACLTPSMFGGVKAVVCGNYVFPKNEKETRQLATLISSCDQTYCIIFDGVETAVAGFDGVENVDCGKLDANSVAQWVMSFGKSQGVTVERAVALKLAQYCLFDMTRVANESQKLVDYGHFDDDAVELMVHKDVEFAVFDLGNVIADKNATKAQEMYKGLLRQGNDARSLFKMLYNFYRRVYYVKTSSLEEKTVADKLGVKSGAISFAKKVAFKYKPMQLKRALDCFQQADDCLKNFVNEDEVMFLLIMQLIAL